MITQGVKRQRDLTKSLNSTMPLTIKALINRYLEAVPVSPPTRSNLERWSLMIGEKGIDEITPRLIKDLRDLRLKTVAISTCNRELSVLKTVLNYCKDELELISSNPISGVALTPGSVKRDRWLTQEEQDRLLQVSPPWLQNLIIFALNTGMRRSEIFNLRWEHVFVEKGYLIVNKSKNGSKRNIPINSVVKQILTDLSYRESDFVFPLIPKTTLFYAFSEAVNRAGIKDLHFHDLRHSFCSKLVMAGVDLYRVQVLAGHSSPAMTQRYAHHSIGSLREAMDSLCS